MALVANIGLVERRKRHRAGIVGIGLGLVIALVAWVIELHPVVRAASAAFFFVGFLGIFQARAQTCVALASRGVRDLDDGPSGIEDAAELEAVRHQARRVLVRSLVATALVTAGVLALP